MQTECRTASENIVNELYENDYTDKLLSSVMTIREIFFTGYLEGSQISAQEAVSFLQRGEEALDAEELMILNNRQAGSFAAENIYRPLNKDYLQVLAQILTNGLDNGGGELRTEDSVDIYFMQGESYVLPSAARLNGCINEITTRSGYTFFGEESISAVIAKSGFKYFDAIAKIVRGANGNDLTYFLDYYLSVLSDFVDEIRDKRKKKDTESIEAEREMARSSLAPGNNGKLNISEAVLEEVDDTIEDIDTDAILKVIDQEQKKKVSNSKKVFLGVIRSFLLTGKHRFTSKDIESAANGEISTRSIGNFMQSLVIMGIVDRYYASHHFYTYFFTQAISSEYTESTSGNSIVKEETFNAILRTITDGHTTEKGKWVAKQFLKYLHSGKNFFTKEEIQQSGGISNYEFRSIIRCYCDKGIIEKKEDKYYFCIEEDMLSESQYSDDIINLIEELINSDKSSKKDKRIGSVIQSCLGKGVITTEYYEKIGEITKMSTDMAFAKQLGLVEPLPDGNYRINNELNTSFNDIENYTKNVLSEMYKIFGDGIFSAEMVIAELKYSHSHTNATLHKLMWLKVLNCTIGEDKRYTYQFMITPEDHPECFVSAA